MEDDHLEAHEQVQYSLHIVAQVVNRKVVVVMQTGFAEIALQHIPVFREEVRLEHVHILLL
jgi:hypothetical protein